jgi:purine-binding chemotaxis protein CheW
MNTNVKVNKNSAKNRLTATEFLPKDIQSVRILQERAQHLAIKKVDLSETKNTVTYISFTLGEKSLFGLPYQAAKEVLHKAAITHLPAVPNIIAGIINWRGVLLTILDLKSIFYISDSSKIQKNHIIITSGNNIPVGILVDNIIGSDNYDPDTLDHELPLLNEPINTEYIIGLANSVTSIINMDKIVNDIQGKLEGR